MSTPKNNSMTRSDIFDNIEKVCKQTFRIFLVFKDCFSFFVFFFPSKYETLQQFDKMSIDLPWNDKDKMKLIEYLNTTDKETPELRVNRIECR